MRYPAEHKQQTRDRIVRAAARRFRGRGSEGAAIGGLMRDLRLTHGGFYRHFASKDDLYVEAFERALEEARGRMEDAVRHAAPGHEFEAIVDSYLDLEHCDDVEGGCPVAALATEIRRQPTKVRNKMLQAVRRHVVRLERYIPGANERERRRNTIALFSGMSGTLAIARAFPSGELRKTVLDAAKTLYLQAFAKS